MQTIIITGSSGILATAIIERLKRKNIKIIAITSQVSKLKEKYENYKNIEVADNISSLSNMQQPIILNCGFPRVNEGDVLAKTFQDTEKLIDESARLDTKIFINISTQSVYNQNGNAIQSEDSVVAPSNLYGMTKYAIEKIVEIKCNHCNMDFINIRLGSLTSEAFDQRMINRFYDLIIEGKKITYDKGTAKVSYLHVVDAANGIEKLIQVVLNKKTKHNIYNLANNDYLSILELIESSVEISEELQIGTTEIISSGKKSDYNNVINSDLFYKEFNWKPKYKMLDIVNDIFIKKASLKEDSR